MHADTISIPPSLNKAVTSLLEMKIKERKRDNSQCADDADHCETKSSVLNPLKYG
jgi:hypothetical protein